VTATSAIAASARQRTLVAMVRDMVELLSDERTIVL
jgi:hypothetical protein